MSRRIVRTGLIVTVETALLLLLAATWGIQGARRPAASTGGGAVLTFEQSIEIGGNQSAARGHERSNVPFEP